MMLKSKKILYALPLGALLAAAYLWAVSPGWSVAADAQVAAAAPAPAIRVAVAEKRELVERLAVNGTIVPRQEAAVGIDLSGLIVEELFFDEGDSVKKGDVLARLDRSSLDTQLAQMDASRAQAEATIEQTRAQIGDAEVGVRQAREALDRAKALQGKGVATKATYDNAVNALDSANARLVSAEKALSASEAQLGVIDAQKSEVARQIARTEVRAPADGLILSRSATLGGIVSASGGTLFRIAVGGEFELAARVAERDLRRIERDMPVKVTLAGALEPVDAKVRMIAPEIDQASRLGTIRVALPAEAAARSGNFARGEIELLRRDCIAVPASALVYRGSDAFLQLVDAGVIRTVAVKTGARDAGHVEIASGLTDGQEVVSRAGTFVADGDHVTPVRGEQTGALKP